MYTVHITLCTLHHTTNQNSSFVCLEIISKHNKFAHAVYSLDFNKLHKWISKIQCNSNHFRWTTSFNHHFIAQAFLWPLELRCPDILIRILLKGMRIYAWNGFTNKQTNKQTIIRILVWTKKGWGCCWNLKCSASIAVTFVHCLGKRYAQYSICTQHTNQRQRQRQRQWQWP